MLLTMRLVAPLTLAGLALLPAALFAYVDGLSPGMTGGFGEPTCQHCHWDNALNEPPGSLRVH